MKINPRLIAAVLSALPLLAPASHAQQHGCGTHLHPRDLPALLQMEARLQQQMATDPRSSTERATLAPMQIPLAFHVVRRSDGSGGISMSQLQQGLDDARRAYAPMNVVLCTPHPIDYIDDDFFYDQIAAQADIDLLRSTNTVLSAINVYCVEALSSNGFALCGISSFPFFQFQGIVMNNLCMGVAGNASSFPHEIAHYAALFHTHETIFGQACVGPTACSSMGDLVCDTPADPGLSYATVDSTTCAYTGGAVDSCAGVAFDPPTENYMSYSRKECRVEFTQGQMERFRDAMMIMRGAELLAGCRVGVSALCLPNGTNSSHTYSVTDIVGSLVASDNDVTLTTVGLPAFEFGFYLVGPGLGWQGLAQTSGSLCITGPIGRFVSPGQVLQSDQAGTMALAIDLQQVPSPTGPSAILAGDTRTFQLWHRDTSAASLHSGLSSAVRVTFQ